jgi:Fe-Mn family superoxide dismutase
MEKIELNYKPNDLKECISETTLNYHYNKHYQKYIDNANFLLKGTQLEDKSSEWIIKTIGNHMLKIFGKLSIGR